MRNYISLQPQRDKIYTLICDISRSRHTVLSLAEEDSDVSESYGKQLEDCEERLLSCLSDLGDMIGFTIMSDIIEGKDIKL